MSAREAGMGVLLVKCPATGKEFSKGINADRGNLVGLRAIVAASICPHCGAEHAWRLEDARYVDVVPPDLCLQDQEERNRESRLAFSARQ
jgi:predicted RNA-binding Zn-ribbon protein involved in translation (DUF1610 family)